jgi:hypothetical protein
MRGPGFGGAGLALMQRSLARALRHDPFLLGQLQLLLGALGPLDRRKGFDPMAGDLAWHVDHHGLRFGVAPRPIATRLCVAAKFRDGPPPDITACVLRVASPLRAPAQ